MTAVNSYRSISANYTCSYIVESSITVMGFLRRICIVLVRTATTAIDVTAIRIVCTLLTYWVTFQLFCYTNLTAMDGHRGIVIGMSVLTTAIYRTLYLGTSGFVVCLTNHNFRIINPCHVVLDGTWCSNITS